MNNKFLALTAAGILIAATGGAMAQSSKGSVGVRGGASANAPGIQMQQNGSVKGTTGASGYAPGRQMQTRGSVKGTTGASGYAPGHINSNMGAGGKVRGNAKIR
jgi:hypothetical protein